VDKSING